jgi:ERCC4-related helicase
VDADPKYNRVAQILNSGVAGEGPWKDKGCVLFTQFYDSASYIAQRLSKDFGEDVIGLYAGGAKSGVYKGGLFKRAGAEELKRMAKARELKILVCTDAASDGLCLHAFGALVNIDLPWNPTRLEQRKGRVQRAGQLAEKIYVYNLRYRDSVEDKAHKKLIGRMEDILKLFGQVPDVLEDVWVAIAQGDEPRADLAINKLPKRPPFVNSYDKAPKDCGDWEKCPIVLDKHEALSELLKGWG